MGNISKWKESLAERTTSRKTINLMQLVYGNSTSAAKANENHDSSEDEDSDGEDFFKPKGEGNRVSHWLSCIFKWVLLGFLFSLE